MFTRLKTWLVAWAQRHPQRELEWLREEGCRLKEDLVRRNGGKPIPLTPPQRRLLAEKAKEIDPEVLKRISVFHNQAPDPECPHDLSTESS